ncbi:MAG: hypothetical protein UX49_C0017G0002 [Candidatus Wolfebacteria bacterium GW2011_GWC2_46_275]|uniref:Uncharacterized protein n=1 Tax=Candidatus Wolfebacteria bacterium GW2011_GWB1_47_1 TaxID=1619007 RepID=A0A0G4AQJ9_9BACT|nr:MAG: hypothetical protein UX70_C0001G0239 [Candidatus Wolfebacteria bacterium GW2011_GWB1_47_1]KKU36364.1 MAG: hypothetical protein UX49_C0017G0002 [Candidatus Wolfebacteria bacterium GW2011_GWC2_46_275]KKU42039.1 MAG: hypothetical protein UX58_C0004G0098 [Candidatus Wolfebacteria bacterium GW2011_GWB2_46_69]KKU54424.1 MAG: hypothetical protein UX76_C0002G0017 [Candidatus Wolfebacteria bacterium GW2011_GWC1_47_103]KKU59752.1 MAG: hypothetical protein UX83_C0002G0039 [Candidatus Wolfebacteria
MRHHIHRIRQSDQQTKRKWLILLSSITILLIVSLWVIYMRAVVFTGSDKNAKEDVRIGFWPVFKNGLTITGSSLGKAFDNIISDMPAIGRRTTTIENPK